ncbi:MAG: NUDIX domain-containing protein [candidate division KSB1 bacterium]|nr:NUDIX domain-containing protein [candidate division KSB1 bacterium]MDZ7369058.1 NUDIX domain-containing protein [candidate division KSB1 bacterium]MDZ7407283.1 NUDIX domain-containing protein [candidate division KSB1 bacterium]
MKVELVDEQLKYDDFFNITVGRLRFEKFDGRMSAEVRRLCLDRGDAVAVVLFNRKKKTLILIEQFRYPVYRALQRQNGWIYELAAGVVEPGETPEEVVEREVKEEVGYEVKNVKRLACIYPSPGVISERIYIYYAEVARQINQGGGLASEHEDIRVIELPVEKAYAMIKKGLIEDAKTLIGLMYAREKFGITSKQPGLKKKRPSQKPRPTKKTSRNKNSLTSQ